MTDDTIDSTTQVRSHYAPTGLLERLRDALCVFGPEEQRLTPQQLAALDHFHTRGIAATADLARLAEIAADDRVLDAGAGVGGPARYLAGTIGCAVTGLDLSPDFTAVARYLTTRTGQSDRVAFETGDVRRMPFSDGSFDVVLLQHVAMNIRDRTALYREIRRVLAEGGRFATYDIVRAGNEPDYPLPWARSAETSFLLDEAQTRDSVEAAGFKTRVWHDDSAAATAFFATIAKAGPPAGPTLAVVMGPDFRTLSGNLGRGIADGRLRVLAAVFAAA